MKAVCHQCGGTKAGHRLPCPACRHTPRGDGRPIAWLFSSAYLSPDELNEASARIIDGEVPDPASSLLHRARRQISALKARDDAPLSTATLVAIGAGSLLLTPLAGFAVWWGLRGHRPRAAAGAMRVTAPIAVALAACWLGMVGLRLFG